MTTSLSSSTPAPEALYGAIREVRRLFHRLANATDRLHADLGVTVAQRALLEALAEGGPATVPDVARGKGVSRQHIQVLANELQAAGLLEPRDNPAHRRSPLLQLTERGRGVFATMRSREGRLLAAAARRLGPRPLERLTADLGDLGDAVEAALSRAAPASSATPAARTPRNDRRARRS